MSDQTKSTSTSSAKRKIGGDLVIPIAGVIFTAYYFSTIIDSPWTAQISAFFIGAILISLSLAFIVRSVIDIRNGRAELGIGALIEPISLLPKRIILLVLTLSYIWLIDYLGFTITTFLFMTCAMTLLAGVRKLSTILVLTTVVSLAGWALFILAFETRFPEGPFETMMERMMSDGI